MRCSRFFVATLLSLSFATLEGIELSDALAKSAKVQVKTLQNPITIVSSEARSEALIKVIVLKDGMTLLDKKALADSIKDIEVFLNSCSDELLNTAQDPSSIKILLAGNFSMSEIEELVANAFSDVSYVTDQPLHSPVSLLQQGEDSNAYVTIQFIPEETSLETNFDLKQFWITKCIETILKEKLTSSSQYYTSLSHSFQNRKFDFACSITATCPQQYALETVEELLAQEEELKKPISESEFLSSKTKIIAELERIRKDVENSDSSTILSLRKDLLQAGSPNLSLRKFLLSSLALLKEIKLDKVNSMASNLLQDNRRGVVVHVPVFSTLAHNNLIAVIENPGYRVDKSKSNLTKPTLESIEVIQSDPFLKHLTLTDSDRHTIASIIETVAYTNPLLLLPKQGEMKRKGDKINIVHPLRFLGVVFTDHELVKALKKIKENGFKWDGFLTGKLSGRDGIAQRLDEEYNSNNFMEYVPGFCRHLGLNAEQEEHVRKYCNKKDWGGLILYLMSIK